MTSVLSASRSQSRSLPRQRTEVRITKRGKAVCVALIASVLLIVGFCVSGGEKAESAPSSTVVNSYVVAPGDTLWSFAKKNMKPGDDITEKVHEIIKINNLKGSAVQVGQRLLVPVE